jgi:hypothetical protein
VVWSGSRYGRYPYYPPPPSYRPPPYRPPPGYRPPPPGYRPPGYPPPGALLPGRPTPYATQWQPDQRRSSRTGSGGVAASVATMEARGWSSVSRPSTPAAPALRPTPPGSGVATRPSVGTGENRIAPGTIGNRPTAGTGTTPSFNPPQNRPPPSPGNTGRGSTAPRPAPNVGSRPGFERLPSSGSGLSDLSNGSGSRDFSNRGAASRGNNSGSVSGRRTGRQ